ncbi:MAG: hypothetical protein IJ608_00625 [Lachnospiraceae bacterium]|nr:hypothetical protein [Lachnospiraceae bacterium]
MKKKHSVLLLIIIAAFMLIGFAKKEVRLLDDNKLIILDKAIDLAKPGGMSGNSQGEPQGNIANGKEESGGGNNIEYGNPDNITGKIVIRIRGKKISYTFGDIKNDDISDTQLESRIRSDYNAGVQVILMDDFAEAHAYKAVREILNKLKNNVGLTYKEEQYTGGE